MNLLSDFEYNTYKRLFELYDANNTGTISLDELRDLMRSLGVFLNDVQLQELLDEFDANGSGEMDFSEFLQLMQRYKEVTQFRMLSDDPARQKMLQQGYKSPYFHTDDPWRRPFDLLLLLICAYFAVVVPLGYLVEFHIPAVVEWLLSAVPFVDLLCNFNTPRTTFWEGAIKQPDIAYRYLRTWFLVDAIAVAPIHLLVDTPKAWQSNLLRSLRLLLLLRVPRLLQCSSHGRITPAYIRFYYTVVPLVSTAFWSLIFFHYCALAGMAVKGDINYLTSIYWVGYLIATVGNGDVAVTTVGLQLFVNAMCIAGVIVNGIIIAKVATKVATGDVESEKSERMKVTLAATLTFHVPAVLREEILAFQYYLNNQDTGVYNTVFEDLPMAIQNQLGLYMRTKLVSTVSLFAAATKECRMALADCLSPVVVVPDQFIIVAGEAASEMFFLTLGFAEVLNSEGAFLTTLKKGDFFGDVGLLVDTKRKVSVRALTYCFLFRLEKDHFRKILELFPKFRRDVEAAEKKRALRQRAICSAGATRVAFAATVAGRLPVFPGGSSERLGGVQEETRMSATFGSPFGSPFGRGSAENPVTFPAISKNKALVTSNSFERKRSAGKLSQTPTTESFHENCFLELEERLGMAIARLRSLIDIPASRVPVRRLPLLEGQLSDAERKMVIKELEELNERVGRIERLSDRCVDDFLKEWDAGVRLLHLT
eukprot:TRINITY_DN7810_c0_g1_i1.p1 TRINITY_DN7810_c0_g1~~TRINITY_DN7810_c0_g1_i1.p1  ORF type:complete len:709 (-),score=125.19 TRINITY_DN7810_c0_g1_i1:12-2138(-)